MKITGYRMLTEKERDYLTIHRLLRRYGISTKSIDEFLDLLKGNLSPAVTEYTSLLEFCIACNDSPSYTLVLSKLPENTVKLLIETKCTTKC